MSEKLKHLPNCITALRIVGTLSLLFTKPMTLWFYIVYSITGVTDVLDGFLARKLKITSDFGAKLDSIADLLFYAVALIMIMPVLWATLPTVIWYGVAVVVFLRLAAYITAAIKFHRFASTHSFLNKITSVGVFAIPFILLFSFSEPLCWIVCIIAGLGSLQELIIHLRNRTYNEKAI